MIKLLQEIIFPIIVLCISFIFSYWLTFNESFLVFIILGLGIALDLLSFSMAIFSVLYKKYMSGFPFLALPFYILALIFSTKSLLLGSLITEFVLLGKIFDLIIFLFFHVLCTMVTFYGPESE